MSNAIFRIFTEHLGGTMRTEFIGNEGDLFYDPTTSSLYISDGVTPGGRVVANGFYTLPIATTTQLGGVKIDGTTIQISGAGVISTNTSATFTNVASDILPSANATYSLGNSTFQWKDLYLSGNTLYIGNHAISVDANGDILFGNAYFVTAANVEASNLEHYSNSNLWLVGTGAPAVNVGFNGDYYVDVANSAEYVLYGKKAGAWIDQEALPNMNGLHVEIAHGAREETTTLATDALIDFYGNPVNNTNTFPLAMTAALTAAQASNVVTSYIKTEHGSLHVSLDAGDSTTATEIAANLYPGYAVAGDVGVNRWNAVVTEAAATGNTVDFVLRMFDTSSVLYISNAPGGTRDPDALEHIQFANTVELFSNGFYGANDVSNKLLIKSADNRRWVAGPEFSSFLVATETVNQDVANTVNITTAYDANNNQWDISLNADIVVDSLTSAGVNTSSFYTGSGTVENQLNFENNGSIEGLGNLQIGASGKILVAAGQRQDLTMYGGTTLADNRAGNVVITGGYGVSGAATGGDVIITGGPRGDLYPTATLGQVYIGANNTLAVHIGANGIPVDIGANTTVNGQIFAEHLYAEGIINLPELDVTIDATNGFDAGGNGLSVRLQAGVANNGQAGVDAGNISIDAGVAYAADGAAGEVAINAGGAALNALKGGTTFIGGGQGTGGAAEGGDVIVSGGTAWFANGGSVTITGGSANGRTAGLVHIGETDTSEVHIGANGVTVNIDGNVNINGANTSEYATHAEVANAYTNAVTIATELADNAYSNSVTFATGAADNAYSNAVTAATSLADNAYSNAVTAATNLADNAYSNAVTFATNASDNAYSNAVTFATAEAGNAYSNAIAVAALLADNAYSNALASANGSAFDAYTNAVAAATLLADNAYSNAATFATLASDNAYSNAVTFATGAADNAYTNAVFAAALFADNAYSNAVAIATGSADNAYSNAIAAAALLADNAYSNATTFATSAANTAYVNAVADANTNAVTLANTAYSNAIAVAALLADNAYSNAIASAANASALALLAVNSDIIPAITNTFNLGNLSNEWHSLYVSSNTIYFSGVSFSVNSTGGIVTAGNVEYANTTDVANAYANAVAYTDGIAANLIANGTNVTATYDANLHQWTINSSANGGGVANGANVNFNHAVFDYATVNTSLTINGDVTLNPNTDFKVPIGQSFSIRNTSTGITGGLDIVIPGAGGDVTLRGNTDWVDSAMWFANKGIAPFLFTSDTNRAANAAPFAILPSGVSGSSVGSAHIIGYNYGGNYPNAPIAIEATQLIISPGVNLGGAAVLPGVTITNNGIAADGGTNVNLVLSAKGSGAVTINTAATIGTNNVDVALVGNVTVNGVVPWAGALANGANANFNELIVNALTINSTATVNGSNVVTVNTLANTTSVGVVSVDGTTIIANATGGISANVAASFTNGQSINVNIITTTNVHTTIVQPTDGTNGSANPGSTLTLKGGKNANNNFANGGDIVVQGGDVGGTGGGLGTRGGIARIVGGSGYYDGGDVEVLGGSAGISSGGFPTGGDIIIRGGDTNGLGGTVTGGSVSIDGGSGNSNGSITIGVNRPQSITIGANTSSVSIFGTVRVNNSAAITANTFANSSTVGVVQVDGITIVANATGGISANVAAGVANGANVNFNQTIVDTLQVNTSITFENNKTLDFQTTNSSSYVSLRQQNDDNFVFYSTNTSGGARPIWSIFANSDSSMLNVQVPVNSPPIYGSFYSMSNVVVSNTANAYLVPIGNTYSNNGVHLGGNDSIIIDTAGVYNIQYSVQFQNSNNQAEDVSVWFRRNGTDIPMSGSIFTVPATHAGSNGKLIAVTPYVDLFSANDALQVMFSSDATTISTVSYTGLTNPTRPDVPTTIISVERLN